MRRKSLWLGIGIVVLVVTGTSVLLLLVNHEPKFYRVRALPAGVEREQRSQKFQSEFARLVNDVINYQEWNASFTDEQINSYLDEDFLHAHTVAKSLPEGIGAPHVAFEPDRMRLAFPYRIGSWSTIISIDLRVWLTTKESNVVAMEIQGLHAGSLPIAAQSLLERITETVRGHEHDIEVSWFRRRNGYPVALFKFQAGERRPTVQLRRLELQQGRLVIGGRSIESPSLRAMLDPRALNGMGN